MTGMRIPAEMVTAAALIQDRITELKRNTAGEGGGLDSFTDGVVTGLVEAQALLFRGAIETAKGH